MDALIAQHKNVDWPAIDAHFNQLFETDWFKERPKDIQAAYRKYPPWRFYTSANGVSCRRIYGFLETKDGEVRAHAVTAMMVINNDVVGGVPLEDCVQVPHYTDHQLITIEFCPTPKNFLLPDGWMGFAYAFNAEEEEEEKEKEAMMMTMMNDE